MLYQKLLMGNQPYFISVGCAAAFENHCHPEIEMSFCLEGRFDIVCEGKRFTLEAGDLAVILPMVGHEVPPGNHDCRCLTVEVGYGLLGSFFEVFTEQKQSCLIYRKSELEQSELTALLYETAALYTARAEFSELAVRGNLYRIGALLLQRIDRAPADAPKNRSTSDLKKIETALEIIYNRYYEPLSIEEISAACGYSQSNFCKRFKTITGDTFHHTLNRHRVEIACLLLREGSDPIEKIARETGFSETKSFCRVFKSLMGQSAGDYRKGLNRK